MSVSESEIQPEQFNYNGLSEEVSDLQRDYVRDKSRSLNRVLSNIALSSDESFELHIIYKINYINATLFCDNTHPSIGNAIFKPIFILV